MLCIRNFINVPDYNNNNVVIKYKRGEEKYEHLLERAKTLMKVYGKNIRPDEESYISDQDETKFEKALSE